MNFSLFFPHLLALLSIAFAVSVPYDPSPFAASGYIQGATLNNASDILSGGTLTFNDITVIIPRNLLVNTPSLTAVAWSELFLPDGSTNLPLWPEVAWEASIFSNYINGRYIAGVVYIFQELGNLNEGFITHIDYGKGEMRVGGSIGDTNSGVRVVINDPVGRFGKVHGDWPLWTADTDNPSIIASTGFPVCVPRVDPASEDDPLCPKKNRPLDGNGKPSTAFTFSAPPVPEGAPDPNLFVPLTIGDFIIYSGILVPDGNDQIIAAYSIEANLGLYTAHGTVPSYLRIETLQAGINGNPAGEIAETRVEGYTTDETATIEIFTIDVDPCTGEESERSWGTAIPRAADRRGQWEFRSTDPSLSPYSREVGVRIARGTVATPNGVMAGRYISPYPPDGFIWPELILFGDPQIPHEFNLLPFLAQGSGPWLGGIPGQPQAQTGPIVKQLDPWPGLNPAPAVVNCATIDPLAPIANAGMDLVVLTSSTVTLAGSTRNNLSTSDLDFAWSQLSGPPVQLSSAASAMTNFTAPSVASLTTLMFKFTVSNTHGNSSDTVMITVNPSQIDHITFQEVSWQSGKGSGTLIVRASTDSDSAQLFMTATNPDIATIPMMPQGGGIFQVLVTVKPAPTQVTVTSSLGGFASTVVSK
ncbi:hypothetical protein HGRIS_009930 [Hohenbuehelia grisea]